MSMEGMQVPWMAGGRGDGPRGGARSDDALLAMVQDRSEEMDRQIRRRDRRETIAAAVVALLVLPALVGPSWLSRVGAAIMIVGCVVTVLRLARARRGRDEAERVAVPVARMLRARLERVDAQVRLLRSVVWWYIAPFAVGPVLIVAGSEGLRWPTFVYGTVVAVLAVVIYVLNQRAVRQDLLPEREELARMLREVEA